MSDETDGQPGSERLSEPELAARRVKLSQRLDEAQARRAPPPREAAGKGGLAGMAAGLKIASEFIAGVVVGALIGYGIDHFFDTRPFGLIVFLLFGFGAGVMNVIRATARDASKAAPQPEDERK